MTLENFVKLENNVEKVIRVKAGTFRIEPREITDPKTERTKTINAAVMDVWEEDGAPVTKTFSTLSEKLASALSAAHQNGTLYQYRVGIKQTGSGFAREYQLRLF